MNSIKWVFGFLLFHRKILLAILLVAGLALWLAYGIDLVPKISSKGDAVPTENAKPRKLPKLEVYTRPKRNTETEPETDTSTGMGMETNPNVDGDDEDAFRDADETADNDNVGLGRRKDPGFEIWLADASVDDLVQESLHLDQEWRKEDNDHPYMFLMLSKRLRISEQLLEMELTDVQHRFATVSYLESLSVLDSTNVHGKLGSEWIRNELLQNAQKYLNDDEQEIASLAHLCFTAIPGYEFINTPSSELLTQLDREIEQHFAEISKSRECIQKLAELIVFVYTSKTMRDETRDFAEKTIQRFSIDDSDEGKERFALMQDQFYFGRLDVPTLIDRVSSKQPSADVAVRDFFTAFEKYPNASLEVHQLALDIVREYIRQERKETAQEFFQRIQENVIPNIDNEQRKQKVQEAADEFEPFL